MQDIRSIIGSSECGTVLVGGVRGASHRRTEKPCQDAGSGGVHYYKGRPYILLVVADGHGGEQYVRSEWGAHFAVQATLDSASHWISFATQCLENEPETWVSKAKDELGSGFCIALLRSWERRVDDHMSESPVSHANATEASNRSAYGTTVAFAIIFHGQVFVGAIGDSRVFLVGTTDAAAEDVLADESSELLGLTTHSLARRNAEINWKYQVRPLEDIRMICAATDGLTDSYPNIASILQRLSFDTQTKGFEWLREKLPEFLERTTTKGVGDDITVALYFPPIPEFVGETANSGAHHE